MSHVNACHGRPAALWWWHMFPCSEWSVKSSSGKQSLCRRQMVPEICSVCTGEMSQWSHWRESQTEVRVLMKDVWEQKTVSGHKGDKVAKFQALPFLWKIVSHHLRTGWQLMYIFIVWVNRFFSIWPYWLFICKSSEEGFSDFVHMFNTLSSIFLQLCGLCSFAVIACPQKGISILFHTVLFRSPDRTTNVPPNYIGLVCICLRIAVFEFFESVVVVLPNPGHLDVPQGCRRKRQAERM